MERVLAKRRGPRRAAPRRAGPWRALPWRALGAALGVLALLATGWLWLRDSSLVSVQRVTVSGASGPQAGAIRSALDSAARDMTTLDVQISRLRSAVARYPVVRDVQASAGFPHDLRIRVIERPPVAALVMDGRRVPVAVDGTILRGVPAPVHAAAISLKRPQLRSRLTDRRARDSLALVGAAPAAVRRQMARVFSGPHGLTVRMRSGLSLYFGDTGRLRAKWLAATRVIADSSSAGARYVDVRLPERPVAAVPNAQALFERATAGVLPKGATGPGGSQGTGTSGQTTGLPHQTTGP